MPISLLPSLPHTLSLQGGRSVLQPFRANQPSTLLFAHRQAKSRNMFAWMPRDLVDRMEREDLAMENHKVREKGEGGGIGRARKRGETGGGHSVSLHCGNHSVV